MSVWNYGVIPNSRFFQKQCKDFLVRNELFSLVSYIFPSFSFEVLKESITLHRSFTKVRIRVGLRQENLHIEKALLTLCFLIVLNFHNQNAEQEHCRGNSTGCSIYSPQCAARANHVLTSTLYGCLYTPTWVFLCLFFSKGCGRPRTVNRQM